MGGNVVHLPKAHSSLQVFSVAPEYPTGWRVQQATQLPREGDMKVVKVESLVGYQSAAAFNRTSKKRLASRPENIGDLTCEPAC